LTLTVVVVGIAAGVTQLVKAQSDRPEATGGIKGEITSIHGKQPIAGATVVIESPGGPVARTTDAQGAFAFDELARGAYAMDVHADGYASRTAISVTVVPGATSPVTVRMRSEGADGVRGPYHVAAIPVHEASAGNIEELLNAASHEGLDLVTALSPVAEDSSQAGQYLLILRDRD
jgi:hypothetical protein